MTHAIIFSTLHDRRICSCKGVLLLALIPNDFSTSERIMKHAITVVTAVASLACVSLTGCNRAESAVDTAGEALVTGDYATAASVTDSVIAAGGADKLIFREKGIARLAEGDYAGAIDTFIKALNCSNGIVEQTDIDISYYLAVAQFKAGELEAAHETADAVIAIRPKDDGAYFLRGKIDLAMGNKDAAISDFDSTVSLDPTNYDRFVGIYEELHSKGYDGEASAYLEKAISAGNKLSDYNKGVLEYYLGSYTDARNDLENAKKNGSTENLILYLGRTYEALGDDGYARSIYEEYIRENSSAGRIYEQLANCRLKGGDYEGALETIESGLSLGNGDGKQGMMFGRVVAQERLYDFAAAKKSMDEYLELYPDDEVARRESIFLSSR